MEKTRVVVFAAGKSGGHIIPCITLFERMSQPIEGICVTTRSPLDAELLRLHPQLRQYPIAWGTQSYRPWYQLPRLCWELCTGFLFCMFLFIRRQPDELITTGGAVAIPPVLAAWVLRIPCTLHELNAFPGRATSYLQYFATTVTFCFYEARIRLRHNAIYHPYPVRVRTDMCMIPHENRYTLVVAGGSQGARKLNEIIKNTLLEHPHLAPYLHIIHQLGGQEHLTSWQQFYERLEIPAHVFSFSPHFLSYCSGADMVITRAGAGMLWELLALRKKMIIIPLIRGSNNHQLYNARAIAEEYPEQCTILDEAELLMTTHALYIQIYKDVHCRGTITRRASGLVAVQG